MLIAGIVLFAAAPILLIIRARMKAKLGQMQGTETTTVDRLAETRDQMPGSFIQRAELKGRVESDSPLKAEFSGEACVAYSTKLEREYEETRWEQDSNGNKVQRTHRGFEQVSQNQRREGFYLRDQGGRIKVIPDGAELVMRKSLSDYKVAAMDGGFSLGGFVLQAASAALGGRRTLGYRYEEWLIPIGTDLYALGEAFDDGAGLALRRSSTKGERFLLSVKSEEELVASARTGAMVLMIVAIVAAALGLGLGIAGIIAG